MLQTSLQGWETSESASRSTKCGRRGFSLQTASAHSTAFSARRPPPLHHPCRPHFLARALAHAPLPPPMPPPPTHAHAHAHALAHGHAHAPSIPPTLSPSPPLRTRPQPFPPPPPLRTRPTRLHPPPSSAAEKGNRGNCVIKYIPPPRRSPGRYNLETIWRQWGRVENLLFVTSDMWRLVFRGI